MNKTDNGKLKNLIDKIADTWFDVWKIKILQKSSKRFGGD